MPSETNFSQVYSHKILDLAASIPRLGRLAAPQATAKAHSKLCGSTIIVDLVMAEGRVIDFAQDVKACALGQAAASIMGRHVIGSSADELRALREEVWAMLKESGPPPKGKWAEIAILEPVRDYKARHASTLLTFDATVDCVNQIEQAAAAVK
jgi:NifU-like protein involved in Fe-S cluster formation